MADETGVPAPEAGPQPGSQVDVSPDSDAPVISVPVDDGAISEDLRQLAQSYGLSDDEVGTFRDEASLRAAMAVMDRHVVDAFQKQYQQPPSQEGGQQVPAPAQWQQPPMPMNGQQQQQPAPAPPEDEFQLNLDDLEASDQVRVAIEKLAQERNSMRSAVQQMQSFVQWQYQAEQQRQANEILHKFHTALDNSGSELYGKKSSASHAQMQNREKVFPLFANLYGMTNSQGQWPDVDLLVSRARNAIHGVDFASAEQQRKAEAIRDRSQQRSAVGRAGGIPGGPGDQSGLTNLKEDPDFMASLREEYYGPAS